MIVQVDSVANIDRDYRPRQRVELTDHVLIPGLINAHTHAAMTLLRGLADDLPLFVWLQEYVWPAEAKWVSEEFVADGTRLAIAEMLSGGVTCFSDMYFFPESAVAVAEEIGMRMVAGMVCFDNPTPYSRNAEECLRKGLELHRAVADKPLITTAFAPHAPYTVGDSSWQQIVALADELDVPIHTHLHETAQEITDSLTAYNERPIDRLQGLGVVTDRLVAAHMTTVVDTDIELLSRASSHVVHCPESNLKLASGFAPIAQLMDARVNVSLGTDGAASNNDLDMLGEMRTAALLAKGVAGDAAAVPAHAVLRMATIGAARALRLADRIGSIEPGKQADLTAVRLKDHSARPMHDPISQLVYTATRHQVSDVWVDGQARVSSGHLVGQSPDELHAIADKWVERLASAG